MHLKPYKRPHLNDLELKGIIASGITLYSGVIFVSKEDSFNGFTTIVLLLMFILNFNFLFTWMYYLL